MAKPAVTALSNYVMEKAIGQGNFAKVKLATHVLTNEKVRERHTIALTITPFKNIRIVLGSS
jgi:hypothetical protein